MHPATTIDQALRLAESGRSSSAIAREIGVPRTTVRDWRAGRLPAAINEWDDGEPWTADDFPRAAYSYLLGLYLGDGCVSRQARTTELRIFFDAAYPGLIGEAVRAVRAVHPNGRVHVARRLPTNCVVVKSSWLRWPALFPQHGPGMKYTRDVRLTDWQRAITTHHPQALIRGLLNSDGCRYVNRVRVAGREYAYPAYQFTNRSQDVKDILCDHLDQLGIDWRRASSRNIAMSRRQAVARLDEFVGPKH